MNTHRMTTLLLLVSFSCLMLPVAAPAATPVTGDVEDLIEQLKDSPSDVHLLAQLQSAIKSSTNEKDKTHGLAVLTAGCLVVGKTEVAQKAFNYLERTYPGSPYTQQVSFQNLSIDCPSCSGSGQVQKRCYKCSGSGTCSGCNGAGSIRTISSVVRCSGCAGTGKCRECNGTGTVPQRCTKCGGGGRTLNTTKAQETYSLLLREKEIAEQQKIAAEQERKRLEAEAAKAKARQAEEERRLAEEQRRLIRERQEQAEREAVQIAQARHDSEQAVRELDSALSELQSINLQSTDGARHTTADSSLPGLIKRLKQKTLGFIWVIVLCIIITYLISAAIMLLGARIAAIEKRSYGKALLATFAGSLASMTFSYLCLRIPSVGTLLGFLLGFAATAFIIQGVFSTKFTKALLANIFTWVLAALLIGAVALLIVTVGLAE